MLCQFVFSFCFVLFTAAVAATARAAVVDMYVVSCIIFLVFLYNIFYFIFIELQDKKTKQQKTNKQTHKQAKRMSDKMHLTYRHNIKNAFSIKEKRIPLIRCEPPFD